MKQEEFFSVVTCDCHETRRPRTHMIPKMLLKRMCLSMLHRALFTNCCSQNEPVQSNCKFKSLYPSETWPFLGVALGQSSIHFVWQPFPYMSSKLFAKCVFQACGPHQSHKKHCLRVESNLSTNHLETQSQLLSRWCWFACHPNVQLFCKMCTKMVSAFCLVFISHS